MFRSTYCPNIRRERITNKINCKQPIRCEIDWACASRTRPLSDPPWITKATGYSRSRLKRAYAVAAILGGTSIGAAAAVPAAGSSDTGSEVLEEIIVTAQHPNQGMPDVPIAMQAFNVSARSACERMFINPDPALPEGRTCGMDAPRQRHVRQRA